MIICHKIILRCGNHLAHHASTDSLKVQLNWSCSDSGLVISPWSCTIYEAQNQLNQLMQGTLDHRAKPNINFTVIHRLVTRLNVFIDGAWNECKEFHPGERRVSRFISNLQCPFYLVFGEGWK